MDAYKRVCELIDEAEHGELLVVNDMGVDVTQAMYALRDNAYKGLVEFVAPNIFQKPLYIKWLGVKVTAGPDEVVPILARINNWTVIPSNLHCLNMLGLSTQVPVYYNYTSTGPDTIIQIGEHLVSFKHCGERYMTELSDRARLLVHAMSGGQLFDCNTVWDRARRVLREHEKQQLRQHMDCVPEWMQPHIQDLIGKE